MDPGKFPGPWTTGRLESLLRTGLVELAVTGPVSVAATRATREEWGEFSSNVLLRSKRTGTESRELGARLCEALRPHWPGTVSVREGRLNFHMSEASIRDALEQATREGTHYGAGESLAGQRILVEFVSTDPTGPLPFAAGRGAAVGEALARLLALQGARVTREFYLNDATTSSKVRLLGESVAAWVGEAFGLPAARTEGTLDDAFVRGVAAELARREGHRLLALTPDERLTLCSRAALEAAVNSQRATLEQFGVKFDEWVSERELVRSGRVEHLLRDYRERGLVEERDGAVWVLSSRFGDDADRPLIRANGEPTYLAGDIAYHLWKLERGFDTCIDLWSPEHQPYVQRTKAALGAAGAEVAHFEFLICHGAALKRDGVPLRLGISGGMLALEEELKELDRDTLKFLFLQTEMKRVAEVDLETARRDDESNPAYAVRLTASRLSRLLREAQAHLGPAPESGPAANEWAPAERTLARLVALWPAEAETAALRRDPARVARFALELASAARDLGRLYGPVSDLGLAPLRDRVALLRAASVVVANVLRTLGLEPDDRF